MPFRPPASAWLRPLVRFVALTVLLSLPGLPSRGWAQDYLVRNWDLEEGLPSTWINAMIRTPDGYIWLATQRGLVRFDGARFVTLNTNNAPALRGSAVASLALDAKGVFWAGTSDGKLLKHAGGAFSEVDISEATQGKRINSMTLDGEGNLWLGTEMAGLVRFKNSRATALPLPDGSPSPPIKQVLTDGRGRVWYLTRSGKLGWVGGDQCRELPLSAAIPGLLQTMARARDGGLWLAASSTGNAGARILKVKNGQATEETQTYPWPQNLARTRANALLEDDAGTLWCGTAGEGVFLRPANGIWRAMAADLPASQSEVLCLMQGEDQSVWIGTRTSGLHHSVPQPLTAMHLPAAHKHSIVLTACARRDGSVWGGTDSAGVFRWQDPRGKQPGEEVGLTGVRINALLEDAQTNLWAGADTGLFEFRNGEFKRARNAAELRNVGALFEDREKNLWAGTANELICVNGDPPKSHDPRNGLPAGQVAALTQDHAGTYWVVIAGKGIFHEEGGQMKLWTASEVAESVAWRWADGRHGRALLPDADGSVWVATYGQGLFQMQESRLRSWLWSADGLPSNHILWLEQDGAGNLWASCENGLFSYAKKALLDYGGRGSPRPIPFRLTQDEGLPYKVCSGGGQPTGARSADGRLWFPDGPALVSFNPTTTLHHPRTWPPLIEEVRVDGVALPLNQSQRIKSGARSFEFVFTSPNFLAPSRLRFRHQLAGLDQNWSEEGNQRSVKYGALPPGDYHFRVMTRESDEDWSGQEAALQLTIVPRWWEMKSLRLIASVAFLGGMALAIRQVERNRSRRKLAAMERERALERERARIARDIHDDLGASLTQVALLGDMAGQTTDNAEELRSQTRQISAAAHEMAQSLEAIVWAVRPENDTLRSLVEYMNRRTDELFEKMPRQYQFITPAQLPECSVHAEVRHNVFLAYKETLTNALKHAQASHVRIEVTCDATTCRITITDNGKGFETRHVRAGGSGLKNIRLRLDEIGGRADVQTEPGRGTTVRLEFPLNREASS